MDSLACSPLSPYVLAQDGVDTALIELTGTFEEAQNLCIQSQRDLFLVLG